jgi:glyoxylase-like metal-dependent hydrolase (beta-lactamase superfamily II)
MSSSEITTRSAGSADRLPDYAPVPQSAFGPAPNEQGYHVGRVERNLYWVTDGVYQAAFLTTQDGVVLFDAPPSIGHNLQRAIDEIARANGVSNKVTYLVHTHHHADHGGASSRVGKPVGRNGHEETRRLLRRDDAPGRPAPEETISERRTLEIGGERIELAWHGANHTPDNSVIHFPEHDALMMVDIVNVGWVPVYVVNLSDDIPGYLGMPATALTYPWKTLISGHLGRLGTRDDVILHQRYMADLEASAKTALATVDPTPYFQKYGAVGNMWGAGKAYLNAVGDATGAPVLE